MCACVCACACVCGGCSFGFWIGVIGGVADGSEHLLGSLGYSTELRNHDFLLVRLHGWLFPLGVTLGSTEAGGGRESAPGLCV